MLEEQRIALIGAGVMAEVLVTGLLRSRLVEPASIVMAHYRQDRLDELRRVGPVGTTTSNVDAAAEADIVVL